ncbi:MAG: sulfatase-like hydrolase/transferase [Acidobacteria bacterium]|nr:sulfatase-like hydrolase/transferase [Acidobacteriota bacterium]
MSSEGPKSSRRRFLQSAALAGAAGASGACAGSGSDAAEPRPLSDNPHSGYVLPGREAVFTPPGPGKPKRRDWGAKNVFVLMLDSFRWDHLGASGKGVVPTPNLDRFASEATLFTHSYPEGLPTVPVRTSLFTGRFTYPFRRWQVLYPEDHPLLAEILWSEGFRTALMADTYHMHKPGYGFSRGFDDVSWIRGQESDPFVRDPKIVDSIDWAPFHKPRGDNDEAGIEQVRTFLANCYDWKSEDDYFTPRVVENGLDWIRRQPRKENLFLWVDSFCPHEPWNPPDKYLKIAAPDFDFSGRRLICPTPGDAEGYLSAEEVRNSKSLYGGSVAFVDECVGRFLNGLREMGLYEDSLIVVMTDHGEPFAEHGIIRKARPWPYEELARTFLMIRHPSGDGVKQVDSYTQQTDLTATILDYLTIEKPRHMTSESLLPLILGKEERIRDEAVCCHYDESVSIRHDEWNYIWWTGGGAKSRPGSKLTKDKPELYNLREDPGEQKNLIDAEPERAADLDRRMRAFTERLLARERDA